MKRLSFITRFKIEFLLLFTGCRKVLGKMLGGSIYTCSSVFLKLGQVGGNLAQIPQIMGRDTQKVIQSVKFHTSHQMKSLVYLGNWGKLSKLSPNTPNLGH